MKAVMADYNKTYFVGWEKRRMPINMLKPMGTAMPLPILRDTSVEIQTPTYQRCKNNKI